MDYIMMILMVILHSFTFIQGETVGGNSRNASCVFPFIYKDMAYTTCIDLDHTKPWCATTDNYDSDRRWGECVAEDLLSLPNFDRNTPTNVSVYQGDTARLLCSVYNLQGKKITWQRKGEDYPLTVSTFSFLSDGRMRVEHDESSEWNLLIPMAEMADTGIYQCRVTTNTMVLVREIHLTVKDRPPQSTPAVTLGESKTKVVEKGKPLNLQCNATSTKLQSNAAFIMPPEVEWFKTLTTYSDSNNVWKMIIDGNKIDSHSLNNILITNQVYGKLRISSLSIEKTQMDDAGIYICRTTDDTNAEVAVRILNGKKTDQPSQQAMTVDKDNKKRGTESGSAPSQLGQLSGENGSSAIKSCGLLLLTVLITQLT